MVKESLEPFVVRDQVFLNTSPALMHTQKYLLPWDKPKVIANKARLSRGPWRIAALLDYDGLVCYQNFHGIWPRGDFPIEVLAALLNGPVANAYLWTRESRENHKVTIEEIPIPKLNRASVDRITKLVQTYVAHRQAWLSNPFEEERASETCYQLLAEIDAVILYTYDLPPRLERQLLDCFQGHRRPGPIEFIEYYPQDFRPFIPWHLYISQEFQDATARATLERLPVINDPLISEALSDLNSGNG